MDRSRVIVVVEPGRVLASGVGRVARSIAEALSAAAAAGDTSDLELLLAGPGAAPPWAAGLPWLRLPSVPSVPGGTFAWHLALPHFLARHHPTLVHLTSGFPAPGAGKLVMTVHDLDVLDHPERHPRLKRWAFQALLGLTVRRARSIVAVSVTTREAVVRRWPALAHRVHVVRNALATEFIAARDAALRDPARVESVRRRYGLPERFVLLHGSGGARSRAELAVGAMRRLQSREPVPLVVSGPVSERAIALGGRSSRVLALGEVPENDLPSLMRAASIVIHPVWADGFGFPPLEALACGTPVTVTDLPITREVLGDLALYVPLSGDGEPGQGRALEAEVERWISAVEHGLRDSAHRARVAALGPRWASRFDARRFGAEWLAVYRAGLDAALDARIDPQLSATSLDQIVKSVVPAGADVIDAHP